MARLAKKSTFVLILFGLTVLIQAQPEEKKTDPWDPWDRLLSL